MSIHHLADKIIEVIKSLIDEQIIICDTNGIIIASTDPERIGEYHEGSVLVIKNKEPLIITNQLATELKGVKTGMNLPLCFHHKVIGVIGITGETEKVKPFGEIVRKMTELLINENNYHEQIEFEHRAVETFLFDLLQSRNVSRPLLDRAETLGISLDGIKQVILLAIDQEDSVVQKRIWQYINRTIPESDTLIRWGNNRLFWMHTLTQSKQIKPDFLKTLQQECESHFSVALHIGIGDTAAADKLYRSYEQALTALNASTDANISYHTDLQLELCLRDISDDTKKEFIKRTISDVVDHKQLLETLKAFLANDSSLQITADALYIHINTLHYRLSKIQQMTGLDPKRFKDLTNLYLAITFLEEYTMIS